MVLMKKKSAYLLLFAGLITADRPLFAADHASQVIDYDISFAGIWNDPSTVLGRPTVDTLGDGVGAPPVDMALVPVFGAYLTSEIFQLGDPGAGCTGPCTPGYIVVRFDDPITDDALNPCGIDFIIFGNSFLQIGGSVSWSNGDPNQFTVNGSINTEPGRVWVSQDGIAWHEFFNGPSADMFAPTLGRIYDPDNPEPSLLGNSWWGAETDATYPLDPMLNPADLTGLTVAQVARKYGYSAGGTGFDLADLPTYLPWIQYIKVEQQAGFGTPEIDAFSDVAPRLGPDLDCDSDVDQDDITIFQSCETGPALGPIAPGCERADLDQDNDIDSDDFGVVQRCYTGPDELIDWSCLP